MPSLYPETTGTHTDHATQAVEVKKLILDGAEFTPETPVVPVAFLTDLATDADGTAIAAFCNALRDALVDTGNMEAE